MPPSKSKDHIRSNGKKSGAGRTMGDLAVCASGVVAFAMVMAMVDEDAMARAGDTAGGPGPVPPTTEEAAEELWALFRLVSPDLPAGPAEAWVDALRELLAERRSLESVSTLYAD